MLKTVHALLCGTFLMLALASPAVLAAQDNSGTPSDAPNAPDNTDTGANPDSDQSLDQQARSQGVPVTDLRDFAEVLERIRSDYVGKVDEKKLIQSAIRGMLMDLDPHSAYLSPDQMKELETVTTGEFGGLGLEVTMQDGLVKVVAPMDDSPASRAGLKAGDLILKIHNTYTKGLTLQEAVEKMRGKAGSKITLQVLSQGEDKPRTLTLTRSRIQVHSVKSEMLQPGYGYLRISQFQTNTGEESKKAIEKLEKQHKLQGLIIDLRNNPGGVLDGAVDVANLFLNKGLIVYTQGRDPENRDNYSATPGDLLHGRPIVVLVNGGTASAAEIVSGALQDNKRAIIVGTRTFGKGSVQTVLPISGNHALKLTTARYYTPSGRSIQAEGITPDIPIRVTSVKPAKDTFIHESDLPNHLLNPNAKKDQAAKNKSKQPPLAERDYPLSQAMDILKGIILSRRAQTDFEPPRPTPTATDDGDGAGASGNQ